jgi:arginase
VNVTILGAPTTAGSHNAGQEKAPRALREAGLVEALTRRGLEVKDAGDTPVAVYRPQGVGVSPRDLGRVTKQASAVAWRVAAIASGGSLPLVIGGDCSITVGVVSGLLTAGLDPVLAYFDGDLDLSTPATSDSGVLDSMVMAHLLGLADTSLARVGPRFPLLTTDQILAVGYHPVEASGSQRAWAVTNGLTTLPVTELSRPGAQDQVGEALARFTGPVLVHFDVDVIDGGDFPLANFPHFNGGLSADEAFACLRTLCAAPNLAAVVVTEVNPHNDADGSLLPRLVDGLARALGQRA